MLIYINDVAFIEMITQSIRRGTSDITIIYPNNTKSEKTYLGTNRKFIL